MASPQTIEIQKYLHHLAKFTFHLFPAPRVVKSGLIVLLIHSVSDMILNCAKVFLYSRPKTVAGNNLNKFVLYILATCFTFSWFINRLYLYPLRAIYYLSFFSVKSSEGRIFGIAYLLLLSVFLMDIYWTYVSWPVAALTNILRVPILKFD